MSMVGSDALLIGDFPSPRTYGCFPVILSEYVREEHAMSLPQAIRKITSFPAQRLGLPDRGLLRDGMKADIVVFHPDTRQRTPPPSATRSSSRSASSTSSSTARSSSIKRSTPVFWPVERCAAAAPYVMCSQVDCRELRCHSSQYAPWIDTLPEAWVHLDGAAVVHDTATHDRLLDPTIQRFACQRRPVLLVDQVFGAHRPDSRYRRWVVGRDEVDFAGGKNCLP